MQVDTSSSIPTKIGDDTGPTPNIFVASTATLISVDEEQDEETSNTWLQTPLSQEEVGMVAEPQLLPEVESE